MRTIKIPNSSQMVGKWGHSLLDCYLCLDQNNTINNPWKFVISWTQIYVCKSLGCSVKIPKKSSHRVPHAISYERNKTPNISDDPCLPPVFVNDLRLGATDDFFKCGFSRIAPPSTLFFNHSEHSWEGMAIRCFRAYSSSSLQQGRSVSRDDLVVSTHGFFLPP